MTPPLSESDYLVHTKNTNAQGLQPLGVFLCAN